uniref:Uncharacterized protein n=1 Tax=Prymnesium polylepis TaxID=72548 RepID=A0A7S4MW82_9EUKA
MLQKPDLSFAHIRWRKRLDRALQLSIIGTVAALVGRVAAAALAFAVRGIARAPLPPLARPLLVAAPLAAAVAAALGVRRRVGGDVADVLASQVEVAPEPEAEDGAGDTTAPRERVGSRPGY